MSTRGLLILAVAVLLSAAPAAPVHAGNDAPGAPVLLEMSTVDALTVTMSKPRVSGRQPVWTNIDTVGLLTVNTSDAVLRAHGMANWEIQAAREGVESATNKVLEAAAIRLGAGQALPGSALQPLRHALGDIRRLDMKPNSVTIQTTAGVKYGLDHASGELRRKGIGPWFRRVIGRPQATDRLQPK